MAVKTLLTIIFLFLVLDEVSSQVCTRTITYHATFIAWGTMQDFYGSKPYPLLKTVLKWKTLQECCHGYVRNKTSNSCVPYCDGGCTDGVCVTPNACRCNEGWKLNPLGQCDPVCSQLCKNGTCTIPKCCRTGYEFKNNTCEPIANEIVLSTSDMRTQRSNSEAHAENSDQWICIAVIVLVIIIVLATIMLLILMYRGVNIC